MSAEPLQFGRIALRGGLLTVIAQAIKIGVQFLSVIVLARLLVPEDFGLVASVSPIVAFVALFQNLGLQQAVVQRKEITQRQLNQVFWMSAAAGLVTTMIVVALAPAVAAYYGDARMVGITIGTGLPLLLGSLAAMPLSLMNRHLQFGQLAINDVVTAIAGFGTAAFAAYAGMGYWSLVLGPAASAVVGLFAAWRVARFRPDKPVLRIDRDIMSFSANLTGFNLVNFFSRNLDNILIGKFSGAIELGYYDRAYKLLLFPLQNINQPLTRLMIPLLSRIQDDKKRFRDIYMQTNWVLAAVTVPAIAALTLTSTQVVGILFGERWLPVAPIFAWLGIAGLIQPISSTTGWIFICQDRTKTMFRWGIYSSVTTVVSFVVGLQWGAVGVAAAYAISGYILRVPVLAVLVHRVGPVTAMDVLLVQGLFIVSALLAWGAYFSLPLSLTTGSDLRSVILALVLNYAIALVLMLLLPRSRQALFGALAKVTGNIR
ncbi:lipopolysaccharide biosynthesis protein [Phyllobacterium endophyticum]|uniref:lipopolysaccharide biosynthesis protein n=1 Tax=Phyllobacterium endophyticum TaxID=1149773 RepID=UPI0011C8360E|nr:lipopolysaccharide biosynthesis protein [Phyllobacterium endophyticum]TXR50010.1 lipopolysaccharide biosynthesis protein [Phyllobacterium endophyticum]